MQLRRPTPLAATLAAALLSFPAASLAADGTGTWFDGLEAGVCFDDVFDVDGNYDFSSPPSIVPCAGPHGDEVVAVVPITTDAWPGDETLDPLAVELCAPEYAAFLGRPIAETAMFDFTVWPSETDWESGVHDVYCIVYANEAVAGTAASGALRAPGHVIATAGEVDGVRDILLVDGASGSFAKLMDNDLQELTSAPGWTHDGTALAFAAEAGEGVALIHLADVNEAGSEVLVDRPGTNDGPAFSFDGTTMVYMSNAEADEFELYALDLASGDTTRLTNNPDRDSSVRWSPDGSQLAFRRRTDGVSDIWVMNADGSDAVRLTDNGVSNFDPRWSPDGSQLLFTTQQAGNYDIWIMDADGSGQRALTMHPGDDEYPDWSPDGEIIAFHSDRHGGVTLWLMRADGSEQSELTGHGPLGYPAFAPATPD